MGYHTLTASDCYSFDVAVHLFTKDEPTLDWILSTAYSIVDKHGSQNKYLCRERLFKYVGIEKIPVDIPSFYYVFVELDHSRWNLTYNVASTVPEELAKNILEYRQRNLCIDMDIDVLYEYKSQEEEFKKVILLNSIERLNNINQIQNLFSEYKVYKTPRGYHIRIPLLRPLSFEEMMAIRQKTDDDDNRIYYDIDFKNIGLEFVTNVCFNKKYWYDEDGNVRSYEEQEIPKHEIDTMTVDFCISVRPLPIKGTITHPKGVIEYIDGILRFKGRFTLDDINSITNELIEKAKNVEKESDTYSEEKKEEYLDVENMDVESMRIKIYEKRKEYVRSIEDLHTAVMLAYSLISHRCVEIVKECKVELKGNVVKIYVPDKLANTVGLLIGKNGMTIKGVEDLLGKKVEIEVPKTEMQMLHAKVRDLTKKIIEKMEEEEEEEEEEEDLF